MKAIDLDDAIKEVKRELAMRKKVFPGWVDNGKLTQEQASHRIAAMEFVLQNLEAQQPQQATLFGLGEK